MADTLELYLLATSSGPQLVSEQILTATTASVTFSNIPAYTRLMLFTRTKLNTGGSVDLIMQLDGDTGSHYVWEKAESNNSTVAGAGSSGLTTTPHLGVVPDTTTANYFGNSTHTIDGWASSTGYATWTGTYSAYTAATGAGSWSGNSSGIYTGAVGPHNSIKLFPASNSFGAGSQFAVYGLR